MKKMARLKRSPQDREALATNLALGQRNAGGIPAPTRETVNKREGMIKRQEKQDNRQRILKAISNTGPRNIKEKKQNRVR